MPAPIRWSLEILESPSGYMLALFILIILLAALKGVGIDTNTGTLHDAVIALLALTRPGTGKKSDN